MLVYGTSRFGFGKTTNFLLAIAIHSASVFPFSKLWDGIDCSGVYFASHVVLMFGKFSDILYYMYYYAGQALPLVQYWSFWSGGVQGQEGCVFEAAFFLLAFGMFCFLNWALSNFCDKFTFNILCLFHFAAGWSPIEIICLMLLGYILLRSLLKLWD